MSDLLLKARPLLLAELMADLGDAGDITSKALCRGDQPLQATIIACQVGCICGMAMAREVFLLLDDRAAIDVLVNDGDRVSVGDPLMRVKGSAKALLAAERTALNVLSHLSGIATATRELVGLIAHTPAKVAATRKTTLGLRALEKYAVQTGGGLPHRYGLYDAVMIKDNHIALVGDVRKAVQQVRSNVGHTVKIEVEVDSLVQLKQVLQESVDIVLLDNMSIDELTQAVKWVDGRCLTEASGGITAANIEAVASTGVNIISLGWLTHSAPALDISMTVV